MNIDELNAISDILKDTTPKMPINNNLYNNLILPVQNIPIRNPNENLEILLQETNKKLAYSNKEIKQLNNKTASQTYQIKQLEADLKDEIIKRKIAEDKLSKKDLVIAIVGFLSMVFGMIIEYAIIIKIFQ